VLTEDMANKFRLSISSPPDREYLVAEIFAETEQFAEISQETESLVIQIYPRQSGEFWTFEFEELTEVLNLARSRLEGTKGPTM
jgi:hypothetical protein